MTIPSESLHDLAGLIASHQDLRAVLAGVQIDLGDSTTSLSVIGENVKTQGWRLEEQGKKLDLLYKLIQGDNGDRSLIMRMAFAERGLTDVAEEVKAHRFAVEEKLTAIVEFDLERQKEARTRNWQFFITLLTIAGGLLAAYLKH